MVASNCDTVGGTKERLNNLNRNLDRHQKNIDELFTKYEGIGRTNWQIVLSAIGVVVLVAGGLWALSSSPINDDLKRLDRDNRKQAEQIAAIQSTQSAILTRLENIDKQINVFRDLIRRVEDERVPTREFTIHQSSFASERLNQQRQLDDLNKKVDAVFPPSKVLEDLTRRLAEIERTATRQSFMPVIAPKPADR